MSDTITDRYKLPQREGFINILSFVKMGIQMEFGKPTSSLVSKNFVVPAGSKFFELMGAIWVVSQGILCHNIILSFSYKWSAGRCRISGISR